MRTINIEELFPHPHNPRKDLGDLTELAASIKENGVMQNLTVVRSSTANDIYTVVIGHRRLAAAKLAGLETLPCQIVEMNECKQISTMLLENMQRSDLTVYEQAQGFQMMLDLGDTVTGIAKQTGFSDTTIRRRVKLLELDAEKFKASEARGATLDDYVKLEQIEDIKVRNDVLESIGTNNFNYRITDAIDRQKRQKNFEKLLEKVREFAIELTDPGEVGSKYNVKYLYSDEKHPKPEDAGTVKYYFIVPESGSYINLLIDKPVDADEKISEASKEREERKRRTDALAEISSRAYKLRSEFIKSLSIKTIKAHMPEIMLKAIELMIDSGYCSYDFEEFAEEFGIESDDKDKINEFVLSKPEICLFITVCRFLDPETTKCWSWDATYYHEEDFDFIYAFLKIFGYEISDEEQSLIDGTHELYMGRDDK